MTVGSCSKDHICGSNVATVKGQQYLMHIKDLKPCHEGSLQVKDHQEPQVIEPIETTEEPDENARVTRSRTKRGRIGRIRIDDGAVEDQRISIRSSKSRGSSEERPPCPHRYYNRKSQRSTSSTHSTTLRKNVGAIRLSQSRSTSVEGPQQTKRKNQTRIQDEETSTTEDLNRRKPNAARKDPDSTSPRAVRSNQPWFRMDSC
ncbi:hypothetical protein KQX54_008755 [Cotesia glomerata]|uniref:Uncharacterized protein n=1 Tax=Cotesia glomerata TaxID=32391 RepID=A0AAV7IYA8_COTGL|nr:hypothetical protein KQX54_008755 [Cotesia glomerata]